MQKTDFNRDWTVQKDGSNEILHVNLPDDAMIREERSKENKTASASAYFDMIPSSRTQKYKNLLGGILCPEKVKLMQ